MPHSKIRRLLLAKPDLASHAGRAETHGQQLGINFWTAFRYNRSTKCRRRTETLSTPFSLDCGPSWTILHISRSTRSRRNSQVQQRAGCRASSAKRTGDEVSSRHRIQNPANQISRIEFRHLLLRLVFIIGILHNDQIKFWRHQHLLPT